MSSLVQVATQTGTTFLSLLPGGVNDTNFNPVVRVPNDTAPMTDDFALDVTQPRLEAFTLDMNTSRLILSFSETVNITSFRPDNTLILVSSPGSTTRDSLRTISTGTVTPTYSHIVYFAIPKIDLDIIKSKSVLGLATFQNNTYLSIPDPNTVKDMFNRPLVAFTTTTAGNVQRAAAYVNDTILPVVERVDLTLSSNATLTAYFSEAIDKTSLAEAGIQLRDAAFLADANTSVNLTSVTILPSNLTTLQLLLSEADANSLKLDRDVATNATDTFIFFYSTAIRDFATNAVNEQSGRAVQVTDFESDVTRPSVRSFQFDLDVGLLRVSFDEAIESTSVDAPSFTIQASATNDTVSYRLTNSTRVEQDGTTINITLSRFDSNEIKKIVALAGTAATTHLTASSAAAQDMNGLDLNAITTNNSLLVTSGGYTADTSPPVPLSFELDLVQERLTITFDETVEASRIVPAIQDRQFILSSQLSNVQYVLTGGVLLTTDDPIVIINITKSDLDQIKLNTNLSTFTNNTQLNILTPPLNTPLLPGVRDMAGVAIRNSTLNASRVVPDTTPPDAVSFSVDLTLETLTISFSEPVNVRTLDVTRLTLQSDRDSLHHHTLSNVSYSNSSNGLIVTIRLSQSDLNALKVNESLVVTGNTTYLAVEQGAVLDMSSNPVVSVQPRNALVATRFQNDTVRPRLVSYHLDMDTAELDLRFSEVVDVSTLNITGITFLQSPNAVGNSTYMLSQLQLLSSKDDTTVFLRIGTEDLNNLQAHEIALTDSTTFIQMSSTTINDMNGRQVVERTDSLSSLAVVPADFSADTTRPELLSYTIDLTQEIIVLTFNETIRSTGFNVTGITLQNGPTGARSNESVVLTSSSYTSRTNSPVVIVYISEEDLNLIKQMDTLANNASNTYLVVDPFSAEDMVGLQVNEIFSSQALPVANFTRDSTSPVLRAFDFDLNTGVLTLSFSETVRSSTLNATELVIQQSEMLVSGVQSYRLEGGDVLTSNNASLQLRLTNDDLNVVKEMIHLATAMSRNNTHISFSNRLIADMFGNLVTARSDAAALPVRSFTQDRSVARLQAFVLDLNADTLTLNFSETVSVSTLRVTDITLQDRNASDNETSSWTLLAGTTLSMNSSQIVIDLDKVDVDEIKRLTNLGTSTFNTYIVLKNTTIRDMTGNYLQAITSDDAQRATNHVVDRRRPRLISFDLDVATRSLLLSFSETVNASSFNATELVFQGSNASDAATYRLRDHGDSSQQDGLTINLTITNNDMNEIKKRPLASNENNTFLSFGSGLVADKARNAITAVGITSAIPVRRFVEDNVPPELLSFDVDLHDGYFLLRFSETVNTSTLVVPRFTFQDSYTPANYTVPLKNN